VGFCREGGKEGGREGGIGNETRGGGKIKQIKRGREGDREGGRED